MMTMPTIRGAPRYHRGSEGHGVSPYHFGVSASHLLRTAALFDDFVRELRTVDQVVLAEIYAARERNTVGISSRDLANKVPGAVYFETLPEVTTYLPPCRPAGRCDSHSGSRRHLSGREALLKQK